MCVSRVPTADSCCNQADRSTRVTFRINTMQNPGNDVLDLGVALVAHGLRRGA